jgi:3-deoxy-D-arabino-heptulosonate 7-phosphate (DAHP) synthase
MVEGNIYGGSQAIPEDLTELKYGLSVQESRREWFSYPSLDWP